MSSLKKLPNHIAMMVEKNNLVMAIKTLADEQNLSMDAAKAQIDAYEDSLKQQQQRRQSTICAKQRPAVPDQANINDAQYSNTNQASTNKANDAANVLQSGLNSRLDAIGYKKPLLPYWAKRLMVIALVVGLLSWLLYRSLS